MSYIHPCISLVDNCLPSELLLAKKTRLVVSLNIMFINQPVEYGLNRPLEANAIPTGGCVSNKSLDVLVS